MTIYRHGHFVWRELMTIDPAASLRFYPEVFGWKVETMKMPDGTDYNLCNMADQGVAGIMKNPAPSAPAFWMASVSVDDVAACAQRVTDAGGKVMAPPMDAAGMGTYAAFLDPQGAAITAWKGAQGDGPVRNPPAVGDFCWEQLNTTDPQGAFGFYAKAFGWTNKPYGQGADNMWVFDANTPGSTGVASVMPNPPGVPAHWLSYIVVDGLQSAYGRVKQQGGKVMVEKIDVPGVGAIGVIQDNVGAVIGVFEQPKG